MRPCGLACRKDIPGRETACARGQLEVGKAWCFWKGPQWLVVAGRAVCGRRGAGVRAGQGPSWGAQDIQVLCGMYGFVEQREKVCAHVTVVLQQGPQQQGGKQGPKGLPLESGLPGGG